MLLFVVSLFVSVNLKNLIDLDMFLSVSRKRFLGDSTSLDLEIITGGNPKRIKLHVIDVSNTELVRHSS